MNEVSNVPFVLNRFIAPLSAVNIFPSDCILISWTQNAAPELDTFELNDVSAVPSEFTLNKLEAVEPEYEVVPTPPSKILPSDWISIE